MKTKMLRFGECFWLKSSSRKIYEVPLLLNGRMFRSLLIKMGMALLTLIVVPSYAGADLNSSTLKALLEQTEVIVIGKASAVTQDEFGAGSAAFIVDDVSRGFVSDKQITITWSDEVHDQSLIEGERYALFLKRHNGDLIAAEYGRSYWVLMEDQCKCSLQTKYEYPYSLIDIPDRYLVNRESEKPTICVTHVIESVLE